MRNLLISIIFITYSFSQSDVLLLSIPKSDLLSITDLQTIEILFEDGLKQNGIQSITKSNKSCTDDQCAKNELIKTNKTDVIYINLQTLGSKIFLRASIINQSSSFTDKVTVTNIEDMEDASPRLAKAIALKESISNVADIDNIMESEVEESKRRESVGRIGFSAGYLYPSNNSFIFNEEKFTQLIKVGSSYYDEFANNTALLAELTYSMPSSPGVDASLLKFMNKDDFSPFIGAGLGMHWVSGGADQSTNNNDHRRSGLTLNLQTGSIFFRTYNVNFIVRLQYLYIFNSNNDNGIVIDFTLIRKPQYKRKLSNRGIFGF